MKDWLIAFRPIHWIKSGFCLAALFFGGRADELIAWQLVFPLLIGQSLLASAGYLANDCINRKEDRLHPRKRNRPVAAGRLSVWSTVLMAIVLAAVGWAVIFFAYWETDLGRDLVWLSLAYLALTLSYSLIFRSVPVVDVLVLGVGFVIRVGCGALALGEEPTWWLLGCTYSLSLMLGFGKRLGEWQLMTKRRDAIGPTRRVLQVYSEGGLRFLIGVTSFVTGSLYVTYCLSHVERGSLLLTVFPVVVGLMAYLRLAWRSEVVESPENLLFKSPVLSGSVILWVGLIFLIGVI